MHTRHHWANALDAATADGLSPDKQKLGVKSLVEDANGIYPLGEVQNQMSNVTHPSHYNSGKIEVIEAIEDWKLGFHLGSAIKYIARAGKKDLAKEMEDLQKAKWYIDRYLELMADNPRRPNDMNPRQA